MNILVALTYYRPHTSGLTIYVERLARELAGLGHRVTVMTSQYDPALPRVERLDGVSVVRMPVAFRLSKGVIQPMLPCTAWRLARRHDIISIHLPQGESGLLAIIGKLARRPVALTYHCDLRLPPTPLNRLINAGVTISNHIAGHLADAIITNTRDYALQSPYLSRYSKIHIVTPPIDMPAPAPADVTAFKAAHHLEQGPFIGMVARLATEKGVEVLLEALPTILAVHPHAQVLFVGPDQVIGEEDYARKLAPLFERYRRHWKFLGHLADAAMPAFFAACDCLALPSLNSTESFGMVQAEAMLCGTPAVASDLPGVRQPVKMTGMGQIVPPGDSAALAQAILDVVANRARYVRPRAEVELLFSARRAAQEYEQIFQAVLSTAAQPVLEKSLQL